ncbi:uncharacterized protein LOC143040846 [Oratosquilla oratoria]|uniref:uncharacterized protein LOC143040846 n=1 Tax=Oratosquilla oratoria TaxID=337810 RepID=UPI003F771B38
MGETATDVKGRDMNGDIGKGNNVTPTQHCVCSDHDFEGFVPQLPPDDESPWASQPSIVGYINRQPPPVLFYAVPLLCAVSGQDLLIDIGHMLSQTIKLLPSLYSGQLSLLRTVTY